MSKPLMKSLIDALLPKGSIWTPKSDGFFEALLLGLGDSFEIVRSKLSELADVRSAKKTTVLDELERDYGVAFNPNLTEAERRAALDSRINAIDNTGSAQELELALQRAGFPVFVYQNSPAVNPSRFETDYLMVANGGNAYANVSTAMAGTFKADLVVNGDIILSAPVFLTTANGDNAFANVSNAMAGIISVFETTYKYFLPSNEAAWPFIFFVGGAAEFSGTGELIHIERVEIDEARRLEIREIVLKYKPAFTWGVLIIDFV